MVVIKKKNEIEKIRQACNLAARVLTFIEPHIKPGISTLELNDLCHEYILKNNGKSATLNYRGYPKSICTSINNVVCHGIPSKDDILQDGDILNIDVTVILEGYFGDTSRMFSVGKVRKNAKLLIERTEKAMLTGIEAVKPGTCICEIGRAIENYVMEFGYTIVRDYGGHGIGKKFHEDPHVHHYYDKKYKVILKPGMIFTVEPMINMGRPEVITSDSDGWTVTTEDGGLSAQFEHTVLVTDDGCEILTIA